FYPARCIAAGIVLSAVVLTWVLAARPDDREPASVIRRSKRLLPQGYSITLSKGGFDATGGSYT
ncbi:hypothetical protein QMW88_22520, partial [Cronobacter dublinensis]|uniref:hypothetical protein n=1 Tax=Cronobacter dublinensis TaxID=413497 RepID=UPI0024C3D8CE